MYTNSWSMTSGERDAYPVEIQPFWLGLVCFWLLQSAEYVSGDDLEVNG
jgi:hypothetical protein